MRLLLLSLSLILISCSSSEPTPSTPSTPAATSGPATPSVNGATLTANPNPITSPDAQGHGVTTLSWNAPGVDKVEIHIGTPDGNLLGGGGTTGSGATGNWVNDGMTFYLQNASTGNPKSSANTLATVTVAVKK